MNFKCVEDLHTRLRPALSVKWNERKRFGTFSVKRDDIWNYLKENKWANDRELFLSNMVSDILEVDLRKVERYRKEQNRRKEERKQ